MNVAMVMVLSVALLSEGYERIGDRSGVVVYRRSGHAIDVAAEGDIDASPDVVIRVLTDYGSHPKWVRGLTVSRVFNKRESALDVYQRLHLPMLDDRDYAMHVTWKGDGDGGRELHFKTSNNICPGPPEKG